MGEKVTARRAAELTGLNERTIRRMIARGDLPAELVSVNRYQIDTSDLPPRKRNRVQEELSSLRADMDALKRRLSLLEKAETPPDAPGRNSDSFYIPDMSSIRYTPPKPPGARYSATLAAPTDDDLLRRVSEVCHYLERHGVSPYTPKTWPWVKGALPISGAQLLELTIEHVQRTGYRASTIVLHKCTQEDCACQVAL